MHYSEQSEQASPGAQTGQPAGSCPSAGKTIWLIRHGRTALQEEKRYQGRTDAPLSSGGRGELKRASIQPDIVYVSPLTRARETAAILFPEAEQVPVPDFREMDFGAFEGRNYMEMENDPEYRSWVDGMCRGRCPGGESRREYTDRVCRAFTDLLLLTEADPRGTLVIVAHGGTQMALLERFSPDRNRDYYEWQLPSGHGYILEARDSGAGVELRVLGQRSFTSCGKKRQTEAER